MIVVLVKSVSPVTVSLAWIQMNVKLKPTTAQLTQNAKIPLVHMTVPARTVTVVMVSSVTTLMSALSEQIYVLIWPHVIILKGPMIVSAHKDTMVMAAPAKTLMNVKIMHATKMHPLVF